MFTLPGFSGDDNQVKTCTVCKEVKPLGEFYTKDKKTGRLFSWCKLCHCKRTFANYKAAYAKDPGPRRQAAREYVAANSEKVRESRKKYLADEETRKKTRDAERAWRAANPENVRAKKARYAKKNGDVIKAWNLGDYERSRLKILARGKAWRDANPERHKEIAQKAKHKRRAAKAGTGGSFTQVEWEAIKAAQNYRCLGCGMYEPLIRLTVDHIIPISKGGTSNANNICGLCRPCNNRKHARLIDPRKDKI